MANPLARVIMNNIVQNSKMIDTKNSSVKNAYSISRLKQNDEQLLINIMNKNLGRATNVSKNLDTLNSLSKSVSKPVEHNNRPNVFEKIKLDDLVRGDVKSKSIKTADNKSNTMMTLNDLASKVKKPSNSQENSVENSVKQQQTKDVYVKTGVINNLEAYIPKVSLNSIGKKGSLL